MPTYDAKLTLTDDAGNTKTLTGQLSDGDNPPPNPEPTPGLDFSADFNAIFAGDDGYTMQTAGDWNAVFADAIGKGVTVQCLEQNTGVTDRQFSIIKDDRGGQCLRLFMPKGSYGMGHRSANLTLGPVNGPVNMSCDFMVEPASVNLFTAGGGKYAAAIQYSRIQSDSGGGLRWMPIWPAGASTLGKQDLCIGLQDQRSTASGGPSNNQWLQPPYYGYRPIMTNHWYKIQTRMTGASKDAPGTVRVQFWKDDDPELDRTIVTTNDNCVQGVASVSVEITSFFGGTAPNAAPADAYFRVGNFRVWVGE